MKFLIASNDQISDDSATNYIQIITERSPSLLYEKFCYFGNQKHLVRFKSYAYFLWRSVKTSRADFTLFAYYRFLSLRTCPRLSCSEWKDKKHDSRSFDVFLILIWYKISNKLLYIKKNGENINLIPSNRKS